MDNKYSIYRPDRRKASKPSELETKPHTPKQGITKILESAEFKDWSLNYFTTSASTPSSFPNSTFLVWEDEYSTADQPFEEDV